MRDDTDMWVHQCQHGFVRRREAIANVVEVDAAARTAAFLSAAPPPPRAGDDNSASPMAMAVFYDFTAALLSSARPYLREPTFGRWAPRDQSAGSSTGASEVYTTVDGCIFREWRCHSSESSKLFFEGGRCQDCLSFCAPCVCVCV